MISVSKDDPFLLESLADVVKGMLKVCLCTSVGDSLLGEFETGCDNGLCGV